MIIPWLYPISIGIPAKYELIGNPSISHLFKFFLVPRKILNTIAKPVVYAKSAPQPIMDGRSPPNRPIKSLIITTIVPVGPVIPVITVALRAISDSWKLDIFLPTVNKERAILVIPMSIPFLSASLLFPTIILLLAPVPIFSLLPSLPRPPVSYHNTRPGRPS